MRFILLLQRSSWNLVTSGAVSCSFICVLGCQTDARLRWARVSFIRSPLMQCSNVFRKASIVAGLGPVAGAIIGRRLLAPGVCQVPWGMEISR